MNLASHLARNAGLRPDAPALARGDTVVATWAEMQARVARRAGGLLGRLGLHPRDRVALLMKNAPLYAELLYAAWHAGLCAVPINAKLHPREVAYILENSGAAAVFVDAGPRRDRRRRARRGQSDGAGLRRDRSGVRGAGHRRSRADGRGRGGRSRLALLHQRHDRPAQGRDAEPSQSSRHGAQLCRRCRPALGVAVACCTRHRCRTDPASTSCRT